MNIRQFFFILALMLTTLTVNAQPPKHHDRPDKEHKFNPEQFARAQEAFIVKEAQLTQPPSNPPATTNPWPAPMTSPSGSRTLRSSSAKP